jgi:hypothetical protein
MHDIRVAHRARAEAGDAIFHPNEKRRRFITGGVSVFN